MLKVLIIILVIVFSKVLEGWSRKNFWGLCALVAITVSFFEFDEVQFQKTQNSRIFETNVSSVLAINSGGGESDKPNYFVPPNIPTVRGNMDSSTGSEPKNERPKYPWGIDPSYRPPFGGGSEGSSGSENVEEEQRIPDGSEWIGDQSIWDSAQESDSSISEEESKAPVKLKGDIDFPYEYDSNGNPTLLIPNTGRLRKKRTYTKVEFDQTAVHIHHASDFDIELPPDFDMAKYLSLDRAGRLNYVNEHVPRETVINYQNAIGKSMCPVFNIAEKTISVPGFAGKHKIGTELIIQRMPGGRNMLSIIREDGIHISSFSLDRSAIEKLIQNDFWVLRDRNL